MTGNEVKKHLKENGINTKNVSVRINRGGYSKAIRIVINDLNIDLSTVRDLVSKEYEFVKYCERTGETLMGGNTCVFVSYDFELVESLSEGV